MFRHVGRAVLTVFLILVSPALRAQDTCPEAKFAEAVDSFGASLRDYNASAQPRLRERLQVLAAKKGWDGENNEERAMAYLEDGRLLELDTQANDLLGRVDQLGRPDKAGKFDCAKLTEIEAATVELLAVMKAKTAYLDDKITREIGDGPPSKTVAAAPAEPKAEPKPDGGGNPKPTPPAPPASKPAAKAPANPDTQQDPKTSWDTATRTPPADRPSDAYQPPTQSAVTQPAGEPYTLPPVTFDTTDEGYTIDEIREATRGFFGTISTNLASVIEHAFASAGRPTGYILGTEGGGAFLAGLRYGKGTLFLRQGGTRPIHWHGPSIGYDVGAEGGRTLILIYKMREPGQLYRSFTGVDGSAYLVGGVGMTLLKGGDIIMAPIRSGIGVRLGANIGYLRFTDRPTWNPF